jgi:hypothetical protein
MPSIHRFAVMPSVERFAVMLSIDTTHGRRWHQNQHFMGCLGSEKREG